MFQVSLLFFSCSFLLYSCDILDTPTHMGDFHWYRLDSDGKWSHKPGRTRVVKYDQVAKDIYDPREANLGRYQFVCFMITDRNGDAVTIL